LTEKILHKLAEVKRRKTQVVGNSRLKKVGNFQDLTSGNRSLGDSLVRKQKVSGVRKEERVGLGTKKRASPIASEVNAGLLGICERRGTINRGKGD